MWEGGPVQELLHEAGFAHAPPTPDQHGTAGPTTPPAGPYSLQQLVEETELSATPNESVHAGVPSDELITRLYMKLSFMKVS
jgi:hypothetical protein